jgi:hypothetical protein
MEAINGCVSLNSTISPLGSIVSIFAEKYFRAIIIMLILSN